MSSPRVSSLAGRLARLGFTDSARAERLLDDPVLAWLAGDVPADTGDGPPAPATGPGGGAEGGAGAGGTDATDGADTAPPRGTAGCEDVLTAIGDAADPDLALLNLVRMLESLERIDIPAGGVAAVPR